MSTNNELTKKELNLYLNDLSKQYKKLGGRHTQCELIIVGGAAIVLNYNFRLATTDIDAFGDTHSILKEAIRKVEDKFNLSSDWLNTDFLLSPSFSKRLVEVSIPYKTFNQVLNVRTISREYLIAMKLYAFRNYKYDKSDIIGIINEENKKKPITLDEIKKAVIKLYGNYNKISKNAQTFITNYINNKQMGDYYNLIRSEEKLNKKDLLKYNEINKKNLTHEEVKLLTEALEKKRLKRNKK